MKIDLFRLAAALCVCVVVVAIMAIVWAILPATLS